jgi:hypothetical protein
MADVASQLQRMSFDGIAFACSHYRIIGGLRDHVHEYIHRPGGHPEKLGRKLYTIEADALFSTNTPLYPDAWPADLSDLRDRFEREVTSTLVIPSVGSIQAYCVDWPIEFDFARMRDGERARLVFREDSDEELLTEEIVQVSFGALPPKFNELLLVAADLDEDLFASIRGLINDIQGIKGSVELQGEIMRDKVSSLIVACQELDEEAKELADPTNFLVMEKLIEIGELAIRVQKDLLKLALPIVPYVVPANMSILDVSVAIYGTTDRAFEILKMNAIPDAFDIQEGTLLRVYAPNPLGE